MQSRKWTNHPNLRLRPLCPASHGRLQGQVRRAIMSMAVRSRPASFSNGPMPQSACGERRLAMVIAGRGGARALGLPIAQG
jgi:hypothetical protein